MNKQELKKQRKAIKEYAKKHLSEHRYRHSVNVAKTAKKLARRYDCSKKARLKAYIAGLAHDMCKEESDDFLLQTAAQDGLLLSDFDKKHPGLLHGRAAAVLLQTCFTISDKKILQAVAHHTLGTEQPCKIAKIIMIADKIEPGRSHATELREKIKTLSLDEALILALEHSNNYLQSSGKNIHPETQKMYDQLIKRRRKNEKRK